MAKIRQALVIGTEIATNGMESGASLRLREVERLLAESGFQVEIVSRSLAKTALQYKWNVIVVVSFSASRHLRKARRKTQFLWFDPTDSWNLTRFSRFYSGEFWQLFVLLRDIFYIWTAPKIDLTTFITRRDANYERLWWRSRTVPLVFPIERINRQLNRIDKPRLVFVGDLSYGPNTRALKFLSGVLELLPVSQQIHVYGRGDVKIRGRFVSHSYTLNDNLYFDQDIHLAPIFAGGGMNLKVAVPLANGLRVITTREGVVGFKPNDNLTVADSQEDFVSEIERLLQSKHAVSAIPINDLYQDDETALIKSWLASIN